MTSFFEEDIEQQRREYLEEERRLEEWKEREYAKQKWQDFVEEQRHEEFMERKHAGEGF